VACRGGGDAVAYFLSHLGTVVACDLARRVFTEPHRILLAYHKDSIDVVACSGAALCRGALGVPLSRAVPAVSSRD